VSGDPPVVALAGAATARLVRAVPEVERTAGRRVTVVGGVAVLCRVSAPHRATVDLDTVERRGAHEPSLLELLLRTGTADGPAGVLVPTPAGPVHVDVLRVTDEEVADPPEDPTDRLHVLAHAWAAATATPLAIRLADAAGPDVAVTVAQPGPLVATKLQAVMNRGRDKAATDLLDIVRLLTDPYAGATSLAQLASAPASVAADAVLHADLWFDARADDTYRRLREIGVTDVDRDTLALVRDLLRAALRR
jgi:hypothetical protein